MTKKMKSLGLLALAIGITGCFVSKEGTAKRIELTKSQKEICSIADKEANYVLSAMERMKGKAILVPEVIALIGVMRYAEAVDNNQLLERVVSLYKAAYLDNGCLNRLSSGSAESQATAIIPLELYRITGDDSLLKDCWSVVVGQMRDVQKNGTYRYDCFTSSESQYSIAMLQAASNRVYGLDKGLKFAENNLELYFNHKGSKGIQFLDKWTEWDKDGKFVGYTLGELERTLPRNHPMREEYNDQYVETMRTIDQEGSLAEASILELAKSSNNEIPSLLKLFRKYAEKNEKRLSSGKMKISGMLPFMQLYSIATGVRYGWLKDKKYKELLTSKWQEFAKDYKAPELWSWNVVYKPLVRSGGRLMFATAMLELDKKPESLKIQKTAKIPSLKTQYSKTEIDTALNTYKILRNAEITDDLKAIEKIQKEFEFDENNPLDSLIAMELARLTGNYDNERKSIEILNNLIIKPLENKDLNSLLLAQGFKVYGTQKFANAAKIKLNDSKLIKNLNISTDPTDPTDLIDSIRAEDIYKLGIASNDANSAIANSAKLRELCNKLQAKTGFYKHCESSKGLCFSRVSGQAIYGITNLLKNLPKENANYAFFVRKIKDIAYALERNQGQNGLWHTLPEDFNSPQDSLGSAFFVATLATALEQKWVLRLEYRNILDLAWKGVQSKIKGSKLTDAVVACEPRKISSSYALLPCNANDDLTKEALKFANSATKSYYASNIPNSEVDKMEVLGSMNELTALLYEGKLPDGRVLKHISTRTSFDVTKVLDCRGKKKDKIIKGNPEIYTENDFRLTGYEILNKEEIIKLPQAIKKLKYPVAGITVWLKDNPSVHTVSDDLGYCILSMPYVPFSKEYNPSSKGPEVLVQISGFKPTSASSHRDYINEMVKEVDDTNYSKTPEGPSDKISGKLLAPVVLAHHRKERNELLAMLGKNIKEILVDNSVIMRPVYLRGKILSSVSNKPVNEATVWLKRNPFIVHHAVEDGEFEILGKDIALYEQTNDALLITAPHYKPVEVLLKSYMDDKLVIKMQPRNYNPIISTDTSLPMVRIPRGVFRMGQGLWQTKADIVTGKAGSYSQPDGRDFETRNCWPIQTVSMPSFYFSQYNITRLSGEFYNWAMQHGYSCTKERHNKFPYPISANALSERDGFTPCYYTADLRVIRTEEDLSENLVCNWRADGYRLPTWAEWVYATRAGRTLGPIFGDDADKFRDYYISKRTSDIFEDHKVFSAASARRLPLDWGIYGATLGQGPYEQVWDFKFWRDDNSHHPRGPVLREAKWLDRMHIGGRTVVPHFIIGIVDNLETQWYDEWPGNPIGFQYSGFGYHIINANVFTHGGDTIGGYVARFVRTAENICNDISLVKRNDDPNLKNPDPVDAKTITAKLDMISLLGGDFHMGSGYTAIRFTRKSKFPVGSSAPDHQVQLSPFSVSKFEITVQQWREVQKWAKANGYTDLPEGSLGKSSSDDLKHPVVDVSWFDALKWCNAVSEKRGFKPCYSIDGKVVKTGKCDDEKVVCDWEVNGYRLPTEAEWEYASQAGSDDTFFWGDDKGCKYSWQGGRTGSNSNGVSHPVGQKYGNRFGLYDTVGNVWEWCWDLKAPHWMNLKTPKDPKGPATKKEIFDYLEQFKKGNKIKGYSLQTRYLGSVKYYQGGRTLKGAAYDTTFGNHNFQGNQFRAGLKPEKSDIAVGFRVVRGK